MADKLNMNTFNTGVSGRRNLVPVAGKDGFKQLVSKADNTPVRIAKLDDENLSILLDSYPDTVFTDHDTTADAGNKIYCAIVDSRRFFINEKQFKSLYPKGAPKVKTPKPPEPETQDEEVVIFSALDITELTLKNAFVRGMKDFHNGKEDYGQRAPHLFQAWVSGQALAKNRPDLGTPKFGQLVETLIAEQE